MSIANAATNQLNVGVNTSVTDAILSASPIVQLTLLTLTIMSIVSWAIIFSKRKQYNEIKEADHKFEDLFWRANSLDDIFEVLPDFPKSTMAKVFKSGYLELRKLADSKMADDEGGDHSPMLTGIDNLERSLNKTLESEISGLESRLTFLATTGSTGPFIGLFGTVWGIMGAFQKIGATGMASLAVVAPGISEALIATAVGLAAAIPATIAYNHFISEIRGVELALSNFAADFLNITKRNFFKES